jgi:hypothetical protein
MTSLSRLYFRKGKITFSKKNAVSGSIMKKNAAIIAILSPLTETIAIRLMANCTSLKSNDIII